MKSRFLILIYFLFFIFLSNWSFSQTSISGIINVYTAVDSIYSTKDTIDVANASEFSENDTVMIYQAKGANPETSVSTNPYNFGSVRNFSDLQAAGKYELILIQKIIGNTIVLKAILNNDYNTDELVQLIRVPSYKSVSVDGELSCNAWNGSDGGVLVLMVSDTLFLNSNINVEGKGFRGAIPYESNGDCSYTDSATYGSQYFAESATTISAGFKGEGVAKFNPAYRKGLGRWANGGGGGNARFSGGGGGGNSGNGGYGGEEDTITCVTKPAYETNVAYDGNWNALGGSDGFGLGIQNLVNDSTIFFGGGGGAGTYTTGLTVSNGGNGGGIVIIIAKVIKSNGKTINANGETVTGIVDASGGGAGAGGSIVFDIDSVIGSLTVSTKGGIGGWVKINGKSGPGGGGGGGPVLWNSVKPSNVTLESSGGKPGYADDTKPLPLTHKAKSGSVGTEKIYIKVPLTGFLFNSITSNQQVCMNGIPELISGTEPRGGNGTFSFQWQYRDESTSNVWTDIIGATGRDYQPFALTDTIFYQRIVTSGSVIDKGNEVEIIVHDYVSGNSIFGDDLITCVGNKADTITGTEVILGSGGDNINYQYIWESRLDDESTWKTISGLNDTICLPGTVLDTTYIRRVVISGACYDTTANIEIIGLPQISNNVLSPDQEICEGQIPEEIIGGDPGNGLGPGTYTIYWEEKTESSGWSIVTDSSRNNLAPSNLFETMYYRRTVQSDDCFDISDIVKINVLVPIDNDSIITNSLIYTCYNTSPQIIDGSSPINGDGTYIYQWMESPDGITWIPIADSNVEDYQAGELTVKTYFKRLVSSGVNGCCTSASDSIIIDIYPLPVISILEVDDTICSGEDYVLKFNLNAGKTPYSLIYNDGENNFNETVTNNGLYNLTVSPGTFDIEKSYSYTIVSVEDANNCFATDKTGVTDLMVYGVPVISAGDNNANCLLTYQLSGAKNFGKGIWKQYSGSGITNFVNDTLPVSGINVSTADKYTYIWKVNNWTCTSSDTVDITLYERPHHIRLSPNDTTLYFVDEMNLKGSIVNPDTFSVLTNWAFLEGSGTIQNSINDSIVTLSRLNDLGNPKIIITWTVEKGVCEDTIAQGTIGLKELFTPTGFTPNGDGINDYLKFNGIENSDENELIIFNRWGTEVFRVKNYSNDMGWDGKNNNGNDLPEDTYYYVLTVIDDGISQTHKGFIVIKRF